MKEGKKKLVFTYVTMCKGGKEEKGIMKAHDAREVANMLRVCGTFPLKVVEGRMQKAGYRKLR